VTKKKKQAPPVTRDEGAERIAKLVQYLYDYRGDPAVMAAAMLDATMKTMDGVSDSDAYHGLLREALQAAYDRLQEFDD
jgi:hypothetical protein